MVKFLKMLKFENENQENKSRKRNVYVRIDDKPTRY